jgi:hypothetical protein
MYQYTVGMADISNPKFGFGLITRPLGLALYTAAQSCQRIMRSAASSERHMSHNVFQNSFQRASNNIKGSEEG